MRNRQRAKHRWSGNRWQPGNRRWNNKNGGTTSGGGGGGGKAAPARKEKIGRDVFDGTTNEIMGTVSLQRAT